MIPGGSEERGLGPAAVMERMAGIEPATPSLGNSCSTSELHPQRAALFPEPDGLSSRGGIGWHEAVSEKLSHGAQVSS